MIHWGRIGIATVGVFLIGNSAEALQGDSPEEGRKQDHWAYRKPVRPDAPRVSQPGWVRNPIDAFILARLEKEGLRPSREASNEKLCRRVYLDLTGLPPSPEEVDAFLADDRPDAYERLVDRLLGSPRYGEHRARPWLDLARYADTHGFNFDKPREIWLYRDWVIRALNADLPYTRFTVEQIAGDMLPGATSDQKIATGFHRNTRINTEGGTDRAEARWEVLLDRLQTTATVWLGTTMVCARCHDHKYDPFKQEEFYALLAFFEHAEEPTLKVGKSSTMVMREKASSKAPTTVLRVRGSFEARGKTVTAATPKALHGLKGPVNRLGLARWLVGRDNPLVARVAVNRFWNEVFGRPLVETPEDFGTQGDRPTHPELLDWLATEFVRQGWSMKSVFRLMVTSSAYRQTSRVTTEHLEKDPQNRLLARGPRFRLDAETIRDVALAAAGRLSLKMGGPSVFPIQADTSGVIPINKVTTKWTPSRGEDRYRRGVYTHWRRTSPFVAFAALDAPSREVCTVRRARTNSPLQALVGMNDPGFFDAARRLAARIMKREPQERAVYAFRLCTSRTPDRAERDRLNRAFTRERAEASDLEAWTLVANVLLNLDETLTKE